MGELKKSFLENEFVQDFLTVYEKCHTADEVNDLKGKVVGNNGYALGQQFTLLGTIRHKTQSINGKDQVYLVLPTEEGTELSLMALMGVSSLKNYDLENEITVEYKENGKKKTRTVKSQLVPDFDFERVWQPKSRVLLELAALIASKELDLTGKVVTYLGVAVRQIKAKKADKQNGEAFEKDYLRAIETRLWSME
jgi:hypothetical protein